MKAPIAQRQVTGARRLPRRRSRRHAHAPLRRPLALLYRQSGEARTAAPAAVRAADGRAVPLAPRLQIALHLSLTLIEQHRFFQVPAASHQAALAMPGAMAAAARGNAPATGRFSFATHFAGVDAAHRTPAGAPIGSPRSPDGTSAGGNTVQSIRHDGLVYAGSGFRQIALPSGGGPGHRFGGPASHAGATPPWPLRQEAGVTPAAAIARDPPGHRRLLVARLADRTAAAPVGAAARHASNSVANRSNSATEWHGAGGRDGAGAAGPRDSRSHERFVSGRSDDSPPVRSAASRPAANLRSPTGRSRADRPGKRISPMRAERPDGTNGAAPRSSAAMAAGHPLSGPGHPLSHRVTRRLPGGTVSVPVGRSGSIGPRAAAVRVAAGGGGPAGPGMAVPLYVGERSGGRAAAPASSGMGWTPPRPGRFGPPRATDRVATLRGGPAAPGTAAPLYLAERSGARTAAPASFGSAWAPPPLDYRSAAAPPAPEPPAEVRPAANAVPAAAELDLKAVSRDVISRIEQRLRVERERRGRS